MNQELTKEFYDQGYGSRFFYFRSLRHIDDPNAQKVAAYAESQVNFQINNDKNEEEEFLKATLNGIQLLYEMYIFEKNNELQLIQQRILPLLKEGPIYNQLKECITDNSIDYITFMAILKQIEDNSMSGLQILDNYSTALREFSTISEQLTEKKTYTQIKQQRQFLVPAVHKAGQNTQSQLADAYDEALTYVINQQAQYKELETTLKQNVLPMILNNQNKKILDTSNKKIAYQTSLILRLIQILKTQEKEEVEEHEDTFNQLLDFIANLSDEDPEFENIQQLSDQLLEQAEILESYGQQINDKLKDTVIFNQRGSLLGLTKDVRQKIQEYAKQNNLCEFELKDENGNISKETFNIRNSKHKEQYIAYLKKSIFPKRGKYTDKQVIKKLNNLLRSLTTRKEKITLVTENNSALTLDAIVKAVVTMIDGYTNNKNDATLQVIGHAFITEEGNELSEQQEKKILQELAPLIKQNEKTFDSRYRAELKILYPNESRINTKRFNIVAQTKAQAKLEADELKIIKKKLQEQHLQLKDLSQIFQIDNSVKFAETFMATEGGFAGGSIGANVEEQIQNINQMYEWGGITPVDTERLITMVLNAGDGLMGHNNRPALENYFTNVGSMLMFRSGGNALQRWRAQAAGKYQNSTTKIHIYTFGTTYVPESYVLLKTYESLKECYNLLIGEATSTGSRAKIYNPVTEKDKQYEEKDGILIPSWSKTSAENYKKVKIEMVLMGGFLDLMEQMLDKMHAIG